MWMSGRRGGIYKEMVPSFFLAWMCGMWGVDAKGHAGAIFYSVRVAFGSSVIPAVVNLRVCDWEGLLAFSGHAVLP